MRGTQSVEVFMRLSYQDTVSVLDRDTMHNDRTRDLMDRLRALEAENRDLQRLVCYLLQKNETLRIRIRQSYP